MQSRVDLPVFNLPAIRLVPATAGDLDRICDLLWDAEVRRYLCDDVVLPRKSIEAMLVESLGLSAEGLGTWLIEAEEVGYAGIASLRRVPRELEHEPLVAGAIEPVVALYPRTWGTGLATRAVQSLVQFGAEVRRLTRMVAIVDEPNRASHRLMSRCAFQYIGRGKGPKYEVVFYERIIPPPRTESPMEMESDHEAMWDNRKPKKKFEEL